MATLAALALVALALAPGASADVFETTRLLSQGTLPGSNHVEQAEDAEEATMSANGAYLVFKGQFGGVKGLWRRGVETGVIEKVAGGDAARPSISADGQFVSFTTTARLAVVDDSNAAPDVYVRNMALPESQSCQTAEEEDSEGLDQICAFTLVSAVGESDKGLSYEGAEAGLGALAGARSAITASGQQVAFVTTAASNLAGPGTPAYQVAVRNLETRQTTLVTVEYDPATGRPREEDGHDVPVSDAGEGSAMRTPLYFGVNGAGLFPDGKDSVGASISANGTTVAWMGQEISKQAPVLAGELDDLHYIEPLWRRISDGPQAPTRRVSGGSEPSSPACIASGETALVDAGSFADPCQGPFQIEATEPEGVYVLQNEADFIPRLDASGDTIAFLGSARDISSGLEFGGAGESSDLYVANMEEGLSRVQALSRITEVAGAESSGLARTAPIVDDAISPDGTQLAFSTQRTQFPLPTFNEVTAVAAEPGESEMFELDLSDDTLTKVTHGFAGEAEPPAQAHEQELVGIDPYGIEDGSFSPSFSADGDELAFSSTSSNLVYGDGNGASDAFLVARKLFGATPTPQFISAVPPGPSLTPPWTITATASSRSNGTVALEVEVPGAGRLAALARGSIITRVTVEPKGTTAERKAHRANVRTSVVARNVASAARSTNEAGGWTTLTLTLGSRYSTLASAKGGFPATAALSFAATGHPTLKLTVPVTFRRKTKATKARANTARSSKRRPTHKKARR